jgi:hypothetical protein
MKGVMGPFETAVEVTFKRLFDHHASIIEQHEGLIKDAHDQLVEASGKFKEAVERQVDVMVMHNDRHETLKEDVKKLATRARKEFKDASFSPPHSREGHVTRVFTKDG